MADTSQNYSNHIRHDKLLYVYLVMLLASVALAAIGIFTAPVLVPIALIVNSLATILLAANARTYGTKMQDRIIRTEMNLRLKHVLHGDPQDRARDFTLSQFIGLRFAGDDELAELSQIVLDQNITSANEIKKMVGNWQADHLRV